MKSKFLLSLLCIFMVSIALGNQADWPEWLTSQDVVTLILDSEKPLFQESKINAVQFEPVTGWRKSGPAQLGHLDKNGQFKPKMDIEYSQHGSSAIRIDQYVITNTLEIKDSANSKSVGSAEVLDEVQETVLRTSKRMPYFDIPRQQFRMSDQYVLLASPIEIDGVKVSVLYFEPYFSIHPGSQVYFGNLDEKGVFTDAPLNTRMWDYRSGGTVLIHLDTARSKYLTIYRGPDKKSAFLRVRGIGPVKLLSLTVVSDKVFFKRPSKSSVMKCEDFLQSAPL